MQPFIIFVRLRKEKKLCRVNIKFKGIAKVQDGKDGEQLIAKLGY